MYYPLILICEKLPAHLGSSALALIVRSAGVSSIESVEYRVLAHMERAIEKLGGELAGNACFLCERGNLPIFLIILCLLLPYLEVMTNIV